MAKKGDKLTIKQRRFIEDYVKTGSAVVAVKNNYNIGNPKSAETMGYEILRQPAVKKRLDELFPDDFVYEKHHQLMSNKQVAYFVFPKSMSDEEITAHVDSVGIKVIVIRESDKGKLAFYATLDTNAVKSGLDMLYKIKGTYAPEKKELSGKVEMIATEKVKELGDKLRKLQK